MQDTIRQKVLNGNDTLKQLHDTTPQQLNQHPESLRVIHGIPQNDVAAKIVTDTTTICKRNPVADVTYYDSTCFVYRLDRAIADRSVITFASINRERYIKNRELLVERLKDGYLLPPRSYSADWMVPILIFAAFLFILVRTIPGNFYNGMIRFLTMRGVNENSSRDTGGLFQWQSTILNLGSFLTISLFGFLLLKHYGSGIGQTSGFVTWLICFGVVISAITIRHFVCNITGKISSEPDLFSEYLIGIYHIYRAAGIILLIVCLLVLYTTFLPQEVWFKGGIIVVGLLYIIRIIRLFLIFMTRHVSILYLILYLCALEILPVVIIVKYVTGLV